jgi:glutamate formiminotransferase
VVDLNLDHLDTEVADLLELEDKLADTIAEEEWFPDSGSKQVEQHTDIVVAGKHGWLQR